MREILLRGKRLCNDKWMVGNLICCENGERYICCVGSRLNRYKVDPETIGQFTGLTDKNGTKIFEGDILDYWSDVRKSFCKKYETVVYGVENCGCCHSVYGWSSKDQYGYGDYIGHPESCVVVGNIHDNPELLEVV